MSAAKTRTCHSGCEQDVRLSEDHFYLQNITDVNPFEGISNDTCVISYRVVGTTPGLSVSEYERRKRGSVHRTERLDDVNVALCTNMKSSPNNPQGGWLSIVTRCPHHETNAARLVEIWSTLEHNTQHPERPVVHMLCTEMEYAAFHTTLDKYKVIVHRIPHDSTYEDLFDVAASIDGIKMVVNSDISLHEGIEYIPSVVDDEHALALSRHASDAMCLHKNVSQSPGNDQCLHYVGSHDAFVFSGTLDIGPLLKGIFPHYWGSENVVLYELTKVRQVINPCHQIKIYHQHCVAYFSKSKKSAPRVNGARM